MLLLLCLQTETGRAVTPPAALAPPTATPTAVKLDPRRSLGSTQARVGIVEFSDFQCPFCRRFHEQTLPALRERYIDTGKVRYSYRDFLLDGHDQAQQAAVAARCAGRQGAYWKMQFALFDRQRELGPSLYPSLAAQLKLESAAFKACLSASREIARVQADTRYGQRLQVDATPHFFIGKLSGDRLIAPQTIIGARPFERFQAIIEDLLRP